jgi:hypothetical protein
MIQITDIRNFIKNSKSGVFYFLYEGTEKQGIPDEKFEIVPEIK